MPTRKELQLVERNAHPRFMMTKESTVNTNAMNRVLSSTPALFIMPRGALRRTWAASIVSPSEPETNPDRFQRIIIANVDMVLGRRTTFPLDFRVLGPVVWWTGKKFVLGGLVTECRGHQSAL